MLPYLAVVGTVVFLVLIEPDLGTAASIALTATFLLFLGGLRYRYLLGLILAVIPALYFLVVLVPYRLNRVLAFLDPELDPYGIGYQIRQSLIAVGSGGLERSWLCPGQTEIILSARTPHRFYLCRGRRRIRILGMLNRTGSLWVASFGEGTRIAVRAESAFGTYLGLGIACMIVFQAFVNMSMVISLLPTKGLPLPFVSVGGSSMIMTMAAVGILLNISRQGRGAALPRYEV